MVRVGVVIVSDMTPQVQLDWSIFFFSIVSVSLRHSFLHFFYYYANVSFL